MPCLVPVPMVGVEPDEHGATLLSRLSGSLGLAVVLGGCHVRNDTIDGHADEHADNNDDECAHDRVLGQQ